MMPSPITGIDRAAPTKRLKDEVARALESFSGALSRTPQELQKLRPEFTSLPHDGQYISAP
jgi:hypothetical protein